MTRSVLVTGAGKGIGAAIAIALGRQGFTVVVHYRSSAAGAEETAKAVRAAGGDSRLIRFDIAARAECRAAIESDIAAHGAYYGVVNNAGLHRDNVFPLLSEQDWDEVLRTDLDGFYNVLQPCIMPMIQAHRGGRIVTMSSAAGVFGNRGQVNYSAAKAGVIGASKALALELAKRGVTVNCVAPGWIDNLELSGEERKRIAESIPMRRMGRPEEVAALVGYLFSDAAGYVTRQVISIDGGL